MRLQTCRRVVLALLCVIALVCPAAAAEHPARTLKFNASDPLDRVEIGKLKSANAQAKRFTGLGTLHLTTGGTVALTVTEDVDKQRRRSSFVIQSKGTRRPKLKLTFTLAGTPPAVTKAETSFESASRVKLHRKNKTHVSIVGPADFDGVALSVVNAGTLPGAAVNGVLHTVWEVLVIANDLAQLPTLVLDGTVDRRGDGETYSPVPAGTLVYLDDGGVDLRFDIATFEGTVQPSSGGFYLREHNVVLTRFVNAENDFACSSSLDQNQVGTRTGGGVSRGFTFTYASTRETGSDFGGLGEIVGAGNPSVEYASDERCTGTMSGPGGLSLAFSDRRTYHAVFLSKLAEDQKNAFTVTGTAGGSTWALEDGFVKRTFADGFAVESDFWDGTGGTLTRNGAAFGTIEFKSQPTGAGTTTFDIVLKTGAKTTVLESHPTE